MVRIKNLALVIGTRPQILKSVPIIHAASRSKRIRLSVIHTGQHYDYEMSRVFFSEFNLPKPSFNLRVGPGTHVKQIADIMCRLERHLHEMRPDWVLVPGDTNSALAAGLAASKLGFAVAHIEAGARSYDMSMPEEVNRRLLDHLSGLLFAPTATCAKNLVLEGIPRSRTIRSGDTMFDLFQEYRHKMMSSDIVERQGLANSRYVFVTVHRQSNIGTRKALADIARAILDVKEVMFVMPVHPHTRARMEEFGIYRKLSSANNIKLTGPLGYFETIRLITSARLVVTDSGGLQKEAFWAGTPCVTLRDTTEWTETIKCGANTLTGVDGNRMVAAIRRSLSCQPRILWKSSLFGNGQAARKIIATLEKR